MHVLPPPITDEIATRAWTLGPEVLYPAPTTLIDRAALEAEEQRFGTQLLKETAQVMSLAGFELQRVLERGDAATEIMEYVKHHQIDLIVCGSRGLSSISGWLLGSVSRKLVHYASCSVLIVK